MIGTTLDTESVFLQDKDNFDYSIPLSERDRIVEPSEEAAELLRLSKKALDVTIYQGNIPLNAMVVPLLRHEAFSQWFISDPTPGKLFQLGAALVTDYSPAVNLTSLPFEFQFGPGIDAQLANQYIYVYSQHYGISKSENIPKETPVILLHTSRIMGDGLAVKRRSIKGDQMPLLDAKCLWLLFSKV